MNIVVFFLNTLFLFLTPGRGALLAHACTEGPADLQDCVDFSKGAAAAIQKNKDIKFNQSISPISIPNYVKTMKSFAVQKEVTALFGVIGMGNFLRMLPDSNRNKKVMFSITGNESAGDGEANPWSYTIRPSLRQDCQFILNKFISSKLKKFAVTMPAPGQFYYDEKRKAVQDCFQGSAATLVLQRNFDVTMDMEKFNTVANDIIAAKPDAVLLYAVPEYLVHLIPDLLKKGFKGPLIVLGYVPMSKVPGQSSGNVYFIRALPHPMESQLPIAKDFRSSVQQPNNFSAFEGFVSARIMVAAILKSGKNPTSETLKNTLDDFEMDLGGIPVKFTTKNHRGLTNNFLYRTTDKSTGYELVETL